MHSLWKRATPSFIDDSPGHLEAGRALGLTAVLFDGDMEKFRIALRQSGLSWYPRHNALSTLRDPKTLRGLSASVVKPSLTRTTSGTLTLR